MPEWGQKSGVAPATPASAAAAAHSGHSSAIFPAAASAIFCCCWLLLYEDDERGSGESLLLVALPMAAKKCCCCPPPPPMMIGEAIDKSVAPYSTCTAVREGAAIWAGGFGTVAAVPPKTFLPSLVPPPPLASSSSEALVDRFFFLPLRATASPPVPVVAGADAVVFSDLADLSDRTLFAEAKESNV